MILVDILYHIEYIIKKHETVSKVPPVHVYINRINNRLVFKTKDEYKRIKNAWINEIIWQHTKKILGKTENGENVQSLELV